MANNSLDFMKDVMGAPFGDLISSVGQGVASAQAALDAGSIAQTLALYTEGGDELVERLREIGYAPTFYTIPETEVEAQVSLTFSVQETSGGTTPGGSPAVPSSFTQVAKSKVYATPMNAGITNRFNLNVAASAKIKFKIVAVPPPGNANEIRVVPDFVGKIMADAETLFRQFSLLYEVTEGPENGHILTQDVEPGKVVQTNTVIKLTTRPYIPDLVGLTEAEAVALIEASKLTSTVVADGSTPGTGKVVSQSPAYSDDPITLATEGDNITITVSKPS